MSPSLSPGRAIGRAAAALLACLALAGSCARPANRPNVLLIVVDTLRADRLSCYGYERATTPNLDRLADRSLRFERAQSPRAKTTPAMASVMTGLYPHDHGVRDLTTPLSGERPVLAEAFRKGGYDTAAVVGNYVLTRQLSGLDRGFDVWIEDLPDLIGVPPQHVPQRTASSMTDAALALFGLSSGERGRRDGGTAVDPAGAPLAARGEDAGPWFLWLHYMDPHGAYEPPAEHRVFRSELVDPIPAEGELAEHPIHRRRVTDYNIPAGALLPDGRADAGSVRDLYDAEIRFADAEIGRLLDSLEDAGLLENTLLVFTSDHGESLGEHRYWFEHGLYAYQATCHVPLLISLPRSAGAAPAGTRRGDISLVDLAPTLLELTGLPPLARMTTERTGRSDSPRGRSRRYLLNRDDELDHPVFSEKIERAEVSRTIQTKAVRMGTWKFIRRYTHLADGQRGAERRLVVLSEELFDLARDPYEEHNLIQAPPPDAPLSRLRAELLRFAQADVRFSDLAELLQQEREELEREDPEALRILRALGY